MALFTIQIISKQLYSNDRKIIQQSSFQLCNRPSRK